MKKITALIICVCLLVCVLSGCNETETFKASGFGSYVKLGDYKNIKIDKNSDEFKEYFDEIHFSNVAAKNCYTQQNEGEIKKGYVANINYVGIMNGMQFDGGTADNYDLTIGSHSFIDGFEDGLIGVKVGETVDLNLKFPDDYESSNGLELAGQPCTFTVTVNYIKIPKSPEESYETLGYKSAKEYIKSVDDLCTDNLAAQKFVESCTYKSTPDVKNFKAVVMLNYYDLVSRSSYGMSLEDYLANNQKTLNDFIESIVERLSDNGLETPVEIRNVKESVLAYYALFDAEDLSFDKKKALGDSTGYERCYKESVAVKEASLKALKKYVKITERK